MKKMVMYSFVILVLSLNCMAFGNKMSKEGNGPYAVELSLEDGWNIIAGTIIKEGITIDSEIQLSDIQSMWYHSPQQKRYIQVHPYLDEDSLQKDDDDFLLTSAMWVFVKKGGKLKYSTLEDYPSIKDRNLYAGYNFVAITPDMSAGPSEKRYFVLDLIKGTCNIQKAFFYDPDGGKWLEVQKSTKIDDFDDILGLGIVVKVSDDCNLGYTENLNVPPELPVEDELPEKISDYSLQLHDFNSDEMCFNLEQSEGEVCTTALNSVLYKNNKESNEIVLLKITSGVNDHKTLFKSLCSSTFDCESYSDVLISDGSLMWYYENDKCITVKQWGSGTLGVRSPAVAYFLNKYPPKPI